MSHAYLIHTTGLAQLCLKCYPGVCVKRAWDQPAVTARQGFTSVFYRSSLFYLRNRSLNSLSDIALGHRNPQGQK